jgi:hypothetical protein
LIRWILPPLQGWNDFFGIVIPGWRVQGALTLGYFIVRLQRTKSIRRYATTVIGYAGVPALKGRPKVNRRYAAIS